MRILVVNWLDRENPRAGGAEHHLHEIFGRLTGRGHEVTLLTSGWSGARARTELDGMEVHRTGGRHTFSFHAPRAYRSRLADRDFDLLVEDLNKVPLFSPFWSRSPVVLLVHHLFGTAAFGEASLPVATATWLLERPVPRVFAGVPTVAVSDSTAADLVARGMDREQITVIPNGVDTTFYAPAPPGEEEDDVPSLLYLGRLKRYKRVDLVIRAVARLRERGVVCRLRVVGKGDRRDALVRLRDRLGLGDDVVEFPGWVDRETKRELLRRSWVHVLTSPKEGWGITNLEAAACGTPTVASDSPGLRDSVRDGRTGLLVPHGDLDALTDALERLLGDHDLRERLGRAAREFAEELDWDRSARRMEEFLEAQVARASGVP